MTSSKRRRHWKGCAGEIEGESWVRRGSCCPQGSSSHDALLLVFFVLFIYMKFTFKFFLIVCVEFFLSSVHVCSFVCLLLTNPLVWLYRNLLSQTSVSDSQTVFVKLQSEGFIVPVTAVFMSILISQATDSPKLKLTNP